MFMVMGCSAVVVASVVSCCRVALIRGVDMSGCEALSLIDGATLEKAKRLGLSACLVGQELCEVPEERLDRICELRERIAVVEKTAEFKEIPFVRKDNSFLLRFLRAKKFDVNRALQLYLNYYKYRHKHGHLLRDMSEQSVRHVLQTNFFALMDTPTNTRSKVLVVFPARVDLDKVPPGDCFRALMLILDTLIEDEETQVHGLSLIQENEGLTFLQVMKASTSEFARSNILFDLIQDAFPARFKSCHMIRQPWYLSVIYRLAKPFLKPKFKDRIHMHGSDMASLYKHIPQPQLPADFGGPSPPLSSNSLRQLLEQQATCTAS